MRRRNYLTLLGSGVIGWWGSNQTTQTQEDCNPTTTQATEPNSNTTQSETDIKSQTGLVVDSSELTTIETFFGTQPAVDATIINTDNTPAGLLKVTVDWLDGNGDAIESSNEYLHLLFGGETWRARIAPTLSDVTANDVADFDLFVPSPGDPLGNVNPDGITVQSESVTAGENQYVRGEIMNKRNGAVDYLEGIGKAYDNNGRVLASGNSITETLSSGETWRMQTQIFTHGRSDQIAEGRVTPVL